MVHVYSQDKVSISFLLNNNSPASSQHLASNTHGFDQLLNAATIINKRPTSSTHSGHSGHSTDTSSYSTSPYADNTHDSIKVKKRKRQNIKCQVCDRTFGDSSSARKHHRVVHLKIKDFACEDCGKTFAEKSNRSKHYIAAHLNQRSHACPDCDKVFNFTDGLRRHRNNVHLGLRPYPCNDCHTSYKQKTHLLKHRQSVHGVPLPSKKSHK